MKLRNIFVAFLALCIGLLTVACGNDSVSAFNEGKYTYDDIVNTGLANNCPQISEFTRGAIPISVDKPLVISDLCVQPQEFFVKEEPINKRQEAQFIEGKLLTRYTTSLDQIRGTITADENGVLTFKETDGIDFQNITVQLPGGAQVPFFFTIKQLVAQTQPGFTEVNSSTDFVGKFRVPSYRGASFLDPKGRGLTSGYDNAVALPAGADKEDYTRANLKQVDIMKGEISLQITKVDQETGEVSGVFESDQPSATDLGAEDPEEVKIRGIFYARVQPQV